MNLGDCWVWAGRVRFTCRRVTSSESEELKVLAFRVRCSILSQRNVAQVGRMIAVAGVILCGAFQITTRAQQQTARVNQNTIKSVYIVPTSHYDFGFVDPPDAVRERAARHIDEVIRVAESDPDFRWTIESVWQVNEWLKRAKTATSVLPNDRNKIERLVKLIKRGRLAPSSAWGGLHPDFFGGEGLNRLCFHHSKPS